MRMNQGNSDYWVIDMIEVQALRRFQSSHSSASKPCKPAPDRFEIDFGRRVLPTGDKK
jgi:hypothetical protein